MGMLGQEDDMDNDNGSMIIAAILIVAILALLIGGALGMVAGAAIW